jgi:capsular polysaccharide biosynthesis protein
LTETLTIQQILNILLRRWKIITLSIVLCAALALGYTVNFISPLYISNASLYVKSRNNVQQQLSVPNQGISISDIAFATMLADTYAIILKSDRFMNIILNDTGITGYAVSSLKGSINIEPVSETEVLSIAVTTTDPEISRRIAQSILDNAEDEIIRIVEIGTVRTIDNASRPKGKSYPSNTTNTLLGAIIGFILAAGISILIEMLDTSVRGAEDLESMYDLPVLGIIPSFDSLPKQQSIYENKIKGDEV